MPSLLRYAPAEVCPEVPEMIASIPPADPSWPKYFRQQYEQHKAIGDFWLTLATSPRSGA